MGHVTDLLGRILVHGGTLLGHFLQFCLGAKAPMSLLSNKSSSISQLAFQIPVINPRDS